MNDEATSNADRDDDTTDFGYTRVAVSYTHLTLPTKA